MTHAASMEFDRQRDRLLALGYPALAGTTDDEFVALIEPIRQHVDRIDTQPATASNVPWVLVINPTLIAPELLVPLLHLQGGTLPGVVDRNHGEDGLTPFVPLDRLGVPTTPAYLIVGIERGEEFCNVRPEDALPVITARGRTPLTIPE
ncbi:MAG: DUF5701 family protein, partial [bacterium]|nr:DUF5701 family protein [bacterium]